MVNIRFYALICVNANTGGYHVLWLCLLYLVGGCIKKGQLFKWSKGRCFVTYIVCIGITYFTKYIGETNPNILEGIFSQKAEIFISYTSPTIVFASISLLVLFSKCEIKQEKIKKAVLNVQKSNFSVFIIHGQYLLLGKLIGGIINDYSEWFKSISQIQLCFVIFAIALVIYITCIGIDQCRIWLFDKAKVNKLSEKIGDKLEAVILR